MRTRKLVLAGLILLLISALLFTVSNAGTAWTPQTVDSGGNVGRYTSLALDSNGNPCISYYDSSNGDLKFARWTGSAWSVQAVDSGGDVGSYSSLALDSAGNPHIGYFDPDIVDGRTYSSLKFASWTGSTWTIQFVDTGRSGYYPSLALDTNGDPHISYYDVTSSSLKYASWTGYSWDKQFVDDVHSAAYSSLALDSSGRPSISYYDDNAGDLKFASWTGSAWSVQAVDSGGDVGSYSSLAVNSFGNLAISYYDATNGYLKCVRAAPFGSGWLWNIAEIVDSAGNVGEWTSVAFDSSGYPCISYYDSSNGDLKFARWTGSAWSVQAVDSGGDVGSYSSLALDSIGRPCISYYDSTNGNLKYAFALPAVPTGSIVINGGAASTSSVSVTLSLTYMAYSASVTHVRYSNDGVWDTEPWEAPAASKAWTLTSGDGTKTVYYQIRDSDGMVSTTYSDTIALDTGADLVVEGVRVWYWTDDTLIRSVARGDVDGDGQVEIVTGGHYFDGTRTVAQLCVWNGATLTLENVKSWYWTDSTGIHSVVIANVDGDANQEIVTGGSYYDGTRNVAQLCVWNGATLVLENEKHWYWIGSTEINSVALSDVDGDGSVEIVTGGCYDDGSRDIAQLCMWNGATLALEWVRTWYWTDDTYINSVAVGDVDHDLKNEIVTGGQYSSGSPSYLDVAQLCSWNGATLALESVKTWYWTDHTYVYSVAVGDVDGDASVEIVTGGFYDEDPTGGIRDVAQLCVWNGATMALEKVKTWVWEFRTCVLSVAMGDSDGDGAMEIVTGGYYEGGVSDFAQLCVWNGATLTLESTKAWYWIKYTVILSVAVGNVDGDAQMEIITGGYCFDGTRYVAQLCVWS